MAARRVSPLKCSAACLWCARLHYWGIAAALVGMGIVGASSLLSGDSGVADVDPWQMGLGMLLIAASQATQSAQCVAEVRACRLPSV